MEERRLFAREAFPSMFAYCMDVLHLSEAEAYLRISAARASRKHPILLTMLGDGRLHLTGIDKLAPHLTRENRNRLLERAIHRSKRQILELIAEIAPQPDVPVMVRRLPEGRTLPQVPMLLLRPDGEVGTAEPGAWPDEAARHDALQTHAHAVTASAPPVSALVVQPLSPGRYKVQFTASAELRHKLERLQALMGSRGGPQGCDLAAVIEQAVTEKLERLEARRFARPRAPRNLSGHPRGDQGPAETDETETHPSPSSRHIPAAVRRAVWEREGGRCRYVDEHGRRCKERDRLQFHHRHPFGLGGEHSVSNIRLMCRAHNLYLARCDYGREKMARHQRPRDRASQASACQQAP